MTAAGEQECPPVPGQHLPLDNKSEVLVPRCERLSPERAEGRIAEEDSRPIRPTVATTPSHSSEEIGVHGRCEDPASQPVDRFCPHALELRVWDVLPREVAIDELLMDGIAKLDDEIVDTLDEPWIAQQLTEELVLLLDPVRFDERDDRRALGECGQPLP